jgi:hypothetical protein
MGNAESPREFYRRVIRETEDEIDKLRRSDVSPEDRNDRMAELQESLDQLNEQLAMEGE